LVESGSDAVVGIHFCQQSYTVGGSQFLNFAVVKQMINDGMLATQFLCSSSVLQYLLM